jgi:hypothetical protein
MPAFWSVDLATGVTLIGTVWASAGSFWAVTMTGGN